MASQTPLDFDNYRTYEGQPNPTTQAQLQNYMSNQNDLLTEILQTLVWLPSRVYALNAVVYCGGGLWAKCTTGGTSGTTEPQWSTGTVSDGGCVWSVSEGGSALGTHIANVNNPHSVTKAQVGLGNVVNTGDSAAPTQGGTDKFTTGGAYTALAGKVDISQGSQHAGKALVVNSSGNVAVGTISGFVATAQGAANANKRLVTDSGGNVVTQTIYPSWYTDRGDGSDGAFAPTSNTTLGGEYNYSSVSIPSGVTITCSRQVWIKCQGGFTNNGTIVVTPNGGTGGPRGLGEDSTIEPQAGGNGGDGYGWGGQGGAGGTGRGTGGGAGGGFYSSNDFLRFCGSGGGGGGGHHADTSSGDGGRGGGAIFITATNFINNGTIQANGEAGVASTYKHTGGGGGGGGGCIGIFAIQIQQGTLTANGGAGGTTPAGGNGAAGVDGTNGTIKVVEV